MFKNLKIIISYGRHVPLITASTCSELTSIQERLNSGLIYLAYFTSVNLAS